MDARTNDAPLSNVQQLSVVEERSSSTYCLDIDALNRLIDFGREHNPRLKGASEARIAELCEISETTYKSIRKGRNRKPRVDILYSIVALFGGSIDRLIGLAPPRDYARERAAWDATMVEGLQQRIDYLERQKALDDAELGRLRKIILEKGEAKARAESHASDLMNQIEKLTSDADRHRAELRRHRWAMLAVCFILIALCAYLIWEIANPDKGNLAIR